MSYPINTNKVFLVALFLAASVSTAHADAGHYECKADNVYSWQMGELKPTPFLKKVGISFQVDTQETGTLGRGIKPPWTVQKMDITFKSDDGAHLVAAGRTANDRGSPSTTIFKVDGESRSETKFSLISDDPSGDIFSGYCIYQNE